MAIQKHSIANIRQTIENLDASQLKVEKNAFDAINSSDTTLNLVKVGTENARELSEKIDVLNEAINNIIESMKKMEELTNMIVGFAGVITEIGRAHV